DNGNCTLREAILAANTNSVVDGCPAGEAGPNADVVQVPPGTYFLTLGPRGDDAGEHGDLDLTDDVEVRGAGADLTRIDADRIDRVFHVAGGVIATIADLEAARGDAGGGNGGGLENDGELTLSHVTLSNHLAQGPGGGIRNNGLLTVRGSLIAANTTADHGGGIDNHGTAVLENSTFSGNDGGNRGGGLYNLSGESMTVVHCTVHDNTAGSGAAVNNDGDLTASNSLFIGPCSGSVNTSGGGNMESPGDTCGLGASDVVGVADPRLGALVANGGPTASHALLSGSPAIDSALGGACPSTDQRTMPRPVDGDGDGQAECDIGAYEAAEPLPAPVFDDGFESGNTSQWGS
ncbi:MAG: choice-of-anchor Q domain-containing protein, partial [Acidobacteriota bacterium]